MNSKIETSQRDDNFFNHLCKTISPDRLNSQILIEISRTENSIEKLNEIIKDFEIEIKDTEYFEDPGGQQQAILLTLNLNIGDIQEIVLKLVENGFSKIIGYKPMGND